MTFLYILFWVPYLGKSLLEPSTLKETLYLGIWEEGSANLLDDALGTSTSISYGQSVTITVLFLTLSYGIC